MQSIIKLYKKAKDREINELKKEISIYQSQIEKIEYEIYKLSEEMKKLGNSTFTTPLELEMRSNYFSNIKQKINEKLKDKEKIQEKIDKIKEKLVIILGEKKAVEKYEIKIKKRKEKEEDKKLISLYDEIFNNRRVNN